jgi:hypothetical protein
MSEVPVAIGLVKKLCQVMAEAGYIKKRGRNEKFNYDYATEADVVDALREKLASRNVFVFPSVIQAERKQHSKTSNGGDMFITDIVVKWTFLDGDTGETQECLMPGCGTDTGDKGVYKAITGSSKYLFLKAFMLPTGDDPENEKPDHHEGVKAAQSVATAKLRSKDGSEILSIIPYMQGFAALSGSGLSLVRANMDDAMRGKFGWVQKGNVFMIPVEKVSALVEFCTFHSISVLNEVPAVATHPEQKPNGHAPVTSMTTDKFKEAWTALTNDGSTDPLILSAKITMSRAGKATMWIKWNGHEISTFDKDLFPVLEMAINKPAMLEFKENGKYKNLTRVVRLGGLDFSKTDQPYEASDSDVGF